MISANLPSLPDLQAGPVPSSNKPSNEAATPKNGDRFAKMLDNASTRTDSHDEVTSRKSEDVRPRESTESAKADSANEKPSTTESKPKEGVQSEDKGSETTAKTGDAQVAEDSDETAKPESAAAPAGVGDKIALKVDVAGVLQQLPTLATTTMAIETDVAVAPVVNVPTLDTPIPAAVVVPQAFAASTPIPQIGTTTPAGTANPPAGTAVLANPAEVNAQTTPQQVAVSADIATVDLHAETAPSAALPSAAVTTQVPKEVAAKAASSAAETSFASSLHGAQKAEAAPATAATSATKAAQQAATPEPYRQVVQVVAPLRGRDGEYNITLSLNPENLGRVDVALNISNNNVNMQMNADNPNARQMLRDSMSDLRNELNSSGLNAGTLDVDSQDAGRQSQQSTQHNDRNVIRDDEVELDDAELFARLATTASAKNTNDDGRLDALA